MHPWHISHKCFITFFAVTLLHICWMIHMLTTKYVRDHIDEIRKSLERRRSDYPLDEILDLDKKIRALKTEMQELQARRNKESLEIAEMKKSGKGIDKAVADLKEVKDNINAIEKDLPKYEDRV